MKDKNNRTILDVIPLQDTELHELIRKYQAQVSVSKDDVASGKRAFHISIQGQLTLAYRW